jgi:hypothetical protein
MMIWLDQNQIPRSIALVENSLWCLTLPGPDSTIYRSRGEQYMMIWLDQNQILRSTALVVNSLMIWLYKDQIPPSTALVENSHDDFTR